MLVKVGTARRIKHDDIRRGLEWVVRNRKRYGIRIVNVSCGGDYEASYLKDGLSRAAERATAEGLFVCAAAGNLGHLPRHPVIPPASAPSVLTVGGLDDKNRLPVSGWDIYHSSYGPTVDGLQKPEVIAPGIWVAAPILPGTPTAAQAALLSRLAAAPDAELAAGPRREPGRGPRSRRGAGSSLPPLLRQLVSAKLRDNNVISEAYKHVDGTSFARAHRGLARRARPRGQPRAHARATSSSSSWAPRADCRTSPWTGRAGESWTSGAPWPRPAKSRGALGAPRSDCRIPRVGGVGCLAGFIWWDQPSGMECSWPSCALRTARTRRPAGEAVVPPLRVKLGETWS